MHYTPSGEELADRPDAPNPFELTDLVHGLANVAAQHADRAGQQRSGPRGNYVRDTMLTLTMQALAEAGLGLPVTSEGTDKQAGLHLDGKAGAALRAYLKLIAPKLREEQTVPVVKRLRPKLRKC